MKDKLVIGIAGFGVEGRAVYAHFAGKANIHIFDEKEQNLSGIDATFHNDLRIPAFVATVYKTPGIPSHKLVLESSETEVTTLMDLVLTRVRDRAIGITGTKGKSTVSSLTAHVLRGAGKSPVLFGNIGIADMELVEQADSTQPFVFELSSYQCEYLRHSPHVAVLTNFYPEHLSHHGSLERYREAKLNIARYQTTNDVFINASDLETAFVARVVRPTLSKPFETKLLGEHNQRNCAIVVAAVSSLGISEEEARAHIRTFEPLPYRLEKVGIYNGITFYDDSLATIPEATLASIAALGRVDTLILGGEDRGISFEAMADALPRTSINTFLVFPETGPRMVAKLAARTIVPVHTMQDAVAAAYAHTPVGGVVLLSNASPSFNFFKDYKDKSAQYRHWIATLSA